MGEVLNSVLIEEFDPTKVEYKPQGGGNENWLEIAYQTGKIISGELVGFENLKLNNKKELCGIIRMG